MQEFTVYAPAKLNLYLDVLEKRPDGYHNIETLFEKIDLKDEIIIREKASKGIDVKVEDSIVCPSGKDNIVYRAVEILLGLFNVNLGLEIIIKKRIPVASGLGGGSSNAAAVLRSVNEKFNLGISFDRLFSISNKIGKDVPFFMLDVPFAMAGGTGDELEPLDTKSYFTHIIIKPDISISTSEMYKRLDSYERRPKKTDIRTLVSAVKKEDRNLLQNSQYNIFEEVLGDYSQFIDNAKSLLSKAGTRPSFLSGSGPTVFCTVKDGEEASQIIKSIPKQKGIEIFLATTYRIQKEAIR